MSAPIDATLFRAAMARFPGAVTIVTALAGVERRGITATAVCSVSADPPSLLVCLNRKTGTCAAVRESGKFNVNLLPDAASPIAIRFAGVGGVTGEDKFAVGEWTSDERGLPLLAEASLTFCCDVTEITEAGSHSIFVGQIACLTLGAAPALIYEQSRFHRLQAI